MGRKAVLFFVTIFVGWNALQAYIAPVLSGFVPSGIISYIFPLNLAANYLNYGGAVWISFVALVSAWPFISAIHLTKFIVSRKNSNKI